MHGPWLSKRTNWNDEKWQSEEMYGCVLSIVATDAWVLKYQSISIHNAEWILVIYLTSLIQKYYIYRE